MRSFWAVMLVLAGAAMVHAEIRTQAIVYRHGDVELQGYVAYDDAISGQRPGVLIFHDWLGHGPFARKKAERLAELGYVGFALDMYGKGIMAKNPQEAAQLAGKYKNDLPLLRARAQAALDAVKKVPQVDPKRIAAMGFCFGGTCALELARSGAEVVGVVSFHGGLSTANPAEAKNIKGKVLALHGADDPFVPLAEVTAFEEEMRQAGVDWEVVKYGGAVHSFTNPDAGTDNSRGAAYNAKVDARSWLAMKAFFKEVFGQ